MTLIDILKNQIGTDKIVSVFSNDDSNSFVAGFIVYVDEEYFLMNHLTRNGFYDGFVMRKSDQIVKIDQETYYEKQLSKLASARGIKYKDFIISSSDFIVDFLNFVKSNTYVVSIGVNDYESENLMGYIKEINIENRVLSVEHIDDDGRIDGLSSINFDSIYRLDCDGEAELKYKILNQMQ